MLFAFIRDDARYNFYLRVPGIDSEVEMEELIEEFEQEVRRRGDLYYSPEYFESYLSEKGIECLGLEEVAQVYWGE